MEILKPSESLNFIISKYPNSLVYKEDYKFITSKYENLYFDIAVCDIPYGIGVGQMAFLKEKKNTIKQKNGNRLNANKKKKVYTFKDWDNTVPTQEYFDELKRVSKHGEVYSNAKTRHALRTLEQFLKNMLTPIYVRDAAFNIKGKCGCEFDKYKNNIKFKVKNIPTKKTK